MTSDDAERRVCSPCDVVSEVLGASGEDLRERTFVELGGSSLDAVRSSLRLRRQSGVTVSAEELLAASDLYTLLSTVSSADQQDRAQEGAEQPAIHAGQLVPLTWQQRIIWYQSLLDPASTRYHFYALLHFDRTPDVAALRMALALLVRRHPLLRTRVVFSGGDLWLEVPPDQPTAPPDFAVVDVDDSGAGSEQLVSQTGADAPFDLSGGAPARWRLAVLPDGSARLVHAEHHLVHDGMSFVSILEALADPAGQAPDLRYFHYARSHPEPSRAELEEVVAECRQAASAPFPRLPAAAAGARQFLRLPVPADLLAEVRAAAQRASVSLFSVMFTAFSQAMADHLGADRLLLGTAVGNRPVDQEGTVGMFVSTVPVPTSRIHGESSDVTVKRIDAVLSRAIARSEVPITEVVGAIGDKAMQDRDSLINATFSMHQQIDEIFEIAGEPARVEVGIPNGAAKFPVSVIALATGTGADTRVKLLIEGDGNHVTQDDLWSLWTRQIAWLARWLRGGRQPRVSSVDRTAFPVVARVTAHAERTGELVALEDEREQIRYRDLVRLGGAAQATLGWANRTVGILGTASARFFAAAYAVLHAGGTYVSLDATQPAERLIEMVRQSNCDGVVDVTSGAAVTASASLRQALGGIEWNDWDRLAEAGSPSAGPGSEAGEFAYIMFTSGSTGVPKGVLVTRAGLSLAAGWTAATMQLHTGMIIGQTSNVGFDASAFEVWSGLYAGAQIKVAPEEVRGDPRALARWLDGSRVAYTFVATPIAELMMALDRGQPSHLGVLSTAGDRLHPIPAGLPYRVVNMYGPTEATIVATSDWVEPGGDTPPSIGSIVPYAYGRVVTSHGLECPEGMEGELWIGGPNVARGYVGDSRLTAARFVPDPFSPDGRTVYRTGDRVRRRSDGKIDFIGRGDRQLKVGGIRTELGEIEALALRHEGVTQAFVDDPGAADGERRRLRLFVVCQPGVDSQAVKEGIRRSLPPHLEHVTIRFLPELPLTRSGKVDRAAARELGSVQAQTPVRTTGGATDLDAFSLLAPAIRQLSTDEALALAARLVRSAAGELHEQGEERQ